MKVSELIAYATKYDLLDADIEVTATIFYDGDHECITTEELSLQRDDKLTIYVGDTLR